MSRSSGDGSYNAYELEGLDLSNASLDRADRTGFLILKGSVLSSLSKTLRSSVRCSLVALLNVMLSSLGPVLCLVEVGVRWFVSSGS